MKDWTLLVCLCVSALLLSVCVSLEVGIVLCLCVAVWRCAWPCGEEEGGKRRGEEGRAAAPPRSSRAARVASNRESAKEGPRSSPRETREGKGSRPPSSRPIVREALVRRVPLAAELPVHPSEHMLDDCMLAEQRKRSVVPDARTYHTTALPNAIRAAARELTTSDPAIVPLDSDGACRRPLGEV